MKDNLHNYIFKASALWADAFNKSKCPSVCLSVCLSVRLFTFEVPFKRLFAPTSQSRMSNIFRDSESLGMSVTKCQLQNVSYKISVTKFQLPNFS